MHISIPRALAGPDIFDRMAADVQEMISIPRALAGPDIHIGPNGYVCLISIPRALAGPDLYQTLDILCLHQFQSPGPSQALTKLKHGITFSYIFQSPGPSQALT